MKHGNLGKALCLTGIAVASICLAASYLSRFRIEFDVLSHFTLHFVLAIISFAIACFVSSPLRVPVALVLMAAGMIAIGSWGKLRPDTPEASNTARGDTRILKVMHMNLWRDNTQLNAAAAEIGCIDPDVLFVSEAFKHSDGLRALLADKYPYHLPTPQDPRASVVMFSRFPFTSSAMQGYHDGWAFIRGTLGNDWSNLSVVGLHASIPLLAQKQEQQMRSVSSLVKNFKGPSVVMGDFNATPYSAILEVFRSRSGLKRTTTLPTWPTLGPNLPQFAIDHIFISDGLTLSGPAIVGRDAGSDHLPIAASIVVPQAK